MKFGAVYFKKNVFYFFTHDLIIEAFWWCHYLNFLSLTSLYVSPALGIIFLFLQCSMYIGSCLKQLYIFSFTDEKKG